MTTPGAKFSGTDKGGYKFYFDSPPDAADMRRAGI